MNKRAILDIKDKHFLFCEDETLNVFNLLRLFKVYQEQDELEIDICSFDNDSQYNILSKLPYFLELYKNVISNKTGSAWVYHSIDSVTIPDNISDRVEFEIDDDVIVFNIESCNNLTSEQDPHLVKNVRGIALLSLVQDLIKIDKVTSSLTLFNSTSPILLHAASVFLYNKDNAKMVWDVLLEWEKNLEDNLEINKKIYQAKLETEKIRELINKAYDSSISDANFKHLYKNSIVDKIGIEDKFFNEKGGVNLWFVDDQHSNGWSQLIKNIVNNNKINMLSFGSVEDVDSQINLAVNYDNKLKPDLALVDLRLHSSDIGVEQYNADDLSGFKVVDKLLEQWSGLSIMIASASNKLWNMEKAIQKGTVAYWRKSDEVTKESSHRAILTAFEIYIQFTDKFSTTLNKMKYRNVFEIIEDIRNELSSFDSSYNALKSVTESYFDELVQKTSWMCWRKEDESKVNDSLYLGISGIYNEIECFLWDRTTGNLILEPSKKVSNTNNRSDKLIINDSLSCIDEKYALSGKALKDYYESNKAIRNKLSIIHGSESSNDVKHAKITDIETSLLIILCLIHELKQLQAVTSNKTLLIA